ncbi:MAG: VIT domain-containing protein [Gemmatimonadota bacterium]
MDRANKCFIPAALSLTLLAYPTLPALSSHALAQGLIEPFSRWTPGPMVERVSSDVTITVDGARRVAHVEVVEIFRNRSSFLLEGDYLYPIPSGAVFTDFSLFMGEQELRGEVLPAEEARGIYEEIVRRKKDPALIELVGHGVLRARVFPIQPGDSRRVILRYTQVLGRDGDLLRVRYPRIVGNAPGSAAVERPAPVPPPQAQRRHPFTLQIHVQDADRFATPYSPTHTIEVRDRSGDELEISYQGDGTARDFELFLPLREARVGASIVTHAPDGELGYFMLLISPPATREESEIPRDVTLVLDVSGSMSGDKIEQARAALDQILAGLRIEDRFRVITFNSAVHAFRRDFVAASRGNLRAAREYLGDVQAEGGTNVMGALEQALEPAAEAGRLSLIVFLTDGKPTVGETSPERIAEVADQLRDRERVFSFGVGHDVNTYLLDRLAEGGHGSVTYVRPGEDVEVAVSSLTRKISHPALSDLRVVRAPVQLEDFYPRAIPDLFHGEELVLFGRYRGNGRGELVLEGSRAGETLRFRYPVEFARREPGNDFIPKLWAARKAGALSAEIRLHGASPELVDEIRQLGLRYGILTQYTSYLVEEPQFVAADAARPMELMERARALTAAPADQSGAQAFARSEVSAKLANADKLDEAEALSASALLVGKFLSLFAVDAQGMIAADNRGGVQVRHVGRRLMVLRDGSWTDMRFEASLKVIEVAPFSEAYFDLVEKLPGLRPYFALGDRVIVAGDGLAVKLAADGLTTWKRGELRTVLAAFEGSL